MIRDLVQQIKDIGQNHLSEYHHQLEAKTLQRKDKEVSISLAEYLYGRALSEENRQQEIFSLDTNLSEAMQNMQILKDLHQRFKEITNSEMENEILAALQSYPPYKKIQFTNKPDLSVHDYISQIIKSFNALEENKQALADYHNDPKHKDYNKLENELTLSAGAASGKFSHSAATMQKVMHDNENFKPKHFYLWYAKLVSNKMFAVPEVVAQEFFRLIINYQPKTRIYKNAQGKIYVVSKSAVGVESLEKLRNADPEKVRHNINSGKYKGLGFILVLALLLQETDLKLGNILLDKNNRLVKIDGDRCFSGVIHPEKYSNDYKITTEDLLNLPFLNIFNAGNWLDIIKNGEPNPAYSEGIADGKPLLIDPDLKNKPHFRLEINQAILKVLMIPSHFIKDFVGSYTNDPEEVKLLTKLISKRIDHLREAALNETSFQKYVTSSAGKKHAQESLIELCDFTTMGKNHLFTKKSHAQLFEGKFNRIYATAKHNLAKANNFNTKSPTALPVIKSSLQAKSLFNEKKQSSKSTVPRLPAIKKVR